MRREVVIEGFYEPGAGASLSKSAELERHRAIARKRLAKRFPERLRSEDPQEAWQPVKSNIFGFEDQRPEAQQEASKLFEALGQQILSFANQQTELHAQLDNLEDPIVRLPSVMINNKPAMMLLSTGQDETISLVSPGHEPTLSDAWQILDGLSIEEWINLPENPEMLANLKETIIRLPGFHMTRRALDGKISFINGGLDIVILDSDPQFNQALKETETLVEQYFSNHDKPTVPSLHQQRQELADQRKKRSLGRKILDYLKS